MAAPQVLTLEDAIRIARAHHPSVEATRAQLEAARARLSQARAQFLPGVTGSFSYQPQTANFALSPGFKRLLDTPSSGLASVLSTSGAPITAQCVPPMNPDGSFDFSGVCQSPPPPAAAPADYQLFNYWAASLGIYWTAFDWGRTIYGYRAARTAVDAQALSTRASEADVVLNVKLAYYGALAADAAERVAIEALATQNRHLDQARAFLAVGSKTKIDVASAESDTAAAELSLARARGGVESARAQLSAAIGEDPFRDYTLVTPPESADAETIANPPPALDTLVDEALATRPEPEALRLQARSLADTARALRGSYLPSLVLQAGPTWGGVDLASLTTNFSITVSLTYPITGMNPFLVHAQVKEAQATAAVARAQERAERNQVRLETAQARAGIDSAREAVKAAQKLVAAARERRDLAEGRYDAGVGSILELSDAELNYVNAELQSVQSTLTLAQARAELDHALGRL
ncbi:MAG TPA: TolC family protein [Polyangia bacterium]